MRFEIITFKKSLLFLSSLIIFGLTTDVIASSHSLIWENRYTEYMNELSKNSLTFSLDKKISSDNDPLIAALWDTLNSEHNDVAKDKALKSLKDLHPDDFGINDQIYILILKYEFLNHTDTKIIDRLNLKISSKQLPEAIVLTLLSYEEELTAFSIQFDLLKKHYHETTENFELATSQFRNKTSEELKDLFYDHPDFRNYKNGHYSDGVKLFMFCRRNREQKCLMLMKDQYNNIVRRSDGSIWNQPSLGLSSKGIPFNKRNGHTPSGIFLINSVMPETNRPLVFGKFRRLILDFPRKSSGEAEMMKLLPNSAMDKAWWKQTVIARDVGRSLFRIHGTGLKNFSSRSSHYPFVATSGCVAQREKKYKGIEYIDQRHLLDTMMQAQGLPVNFENERKLKGIFYVIEIDETEKAVEYNDLDKILNLGGTEA